YLFVSYGPLVTTYNVRVLVADNPEGPYKDYYGIDPRGEVNTLLILTAPYRFEGHPGWAGLAHCSVFNDGAGNYFLASQGRLQPENMMMDLHIRRLFFNADGWPVVSPERYAGEQDITLTESDLYGIWEFITIKDNEQRRSGEDGQVADNHLLPEETNVSKKIEISAQNISDFAQNSFSLMVDNNKIKGVKVFAGHDWELKTNTLLISAVDSCGFSLWGKKIK
ncbi:MAG: arabinan endo-1,5-alpha-L-arabinosidase, partial [Bacteroidales bacterium]|nr:arabinan endo-1,5-alpha-L-arabinosidase [Bacteroidales bacterium]